MDARGFQDRRSVPRHAEGLGTRSWALSPPRVDGCPILRVLCEGWDDQISPLNLPRKTDLFLRRPGCSVEGCPAYAPCPCGHNDRSDLTVALCALSPPQLPVPHTPGFLWSFVCSLNFLRLSLMKGAHAVLSKAAYREFGASRSFFARCGIPEAYPSSLPRDDRSTRVPYVRTSVARIFYFALLARATCAALRKESRMKSLNATGLHRKSGGKPSTAFRSVPYYLFIPTGAP